MRLVCIWLRAVVFSGLFVCALLPAHAASANAVIAAAAPDHDLLSTHAAQALGPGSFRIDHPENGPGLDGAGSDRFGASLAIEGNWAFVGVPFDSRASSGRSEGAVYVYARQGSQWNLHQKLVATAASNQSCFGWSVAASGATLAISSRRCTGSYNAAANLFALIDGFWVASQSLVIAQSDDSFGQSIDLEGDTLVVGDPGNRSTQPGGAAHVFVRTGNTFAFQQSLLASDGANGDQLGFSVSLAGDRILAGAPYNALGGFAEGSAYLFQRAAGVWTQRQAIFPGDPEAFGQFGQSVGLTSELAVIGSPNDAVNDSNRPGSAYVYANNGTVYAFQHKLRSNDGANGDEFGSSLVASGLTVIVGAPGKIFGGNDNQGAAYAFVRVGGNWTQQARLIAPEVDAEDAFGFSLAVAGEEVLVGASTRTFNGNLAQGAVFAFVRLGGAWAPTQQLASGDGAALAQFGAAIAVAGDIAVVGAPRDSVENAQAQGAAYIFLRSQASWMLLQKIVASDGAAGDNFGTAVDMESNTIVVGAQLADAGATSDAGAAYVFERVGNLWTQRQKLASATPSNAAHFGASLALGGDSIVVGSAQENVGSANRQGAAHVFARANGSWSFDERLLAPDGVVGDRFGHAVDMVAGTIVVSTRDDDNGFKIARGSVHVFEQSGDVWLPQQKLTVAPPFETLGLDVALTRDRFVVGSRLIGGGGAVYVFDRQGSVWSQSQRLEDAQPGLDATPHSETVVIRGDTLAVRWPIVNAVGRTEPQVSVFHRQGITWTRSAVLRPGDDDPSSGFGASIILDTSGFIVGSPSATGTDEFANPETGAVTVFIDDIFNDGFEPVP